MPTSRQALLALDRPARRSGPQKSPLVIMLHGRGADERDLLGLEPYLDERCAIVSLRAPYRFSFGGFTWFDLDAAGGADTAMLQTSYDALMTSVDAAVARLDTDPDRTYLLGFSMGTMMAYVAALTAPEKFAGVIAQSGFIIETPLFTFRWNEAQACPVIATHGIHDPVIPVEMARRTRDLLRSHAVPLDYREYAMGHETSEESIGAVGAWLAERLDASEKT